MSKTLQEPQKVNFKILIIALSVISLLVGSLSDLIYLSTWFVGGGWFPTFEAVIDDPGQISVYLYFLFDLLDIVITVIPCVLLIAYVLYFYKKFSARFILAVIFLLLLYPAFRSSIYLILNILRGYFGGFEYFAQQIFINILPNLPLLVLAVLAIFGVKNKLIYVITLMFSLVSPLYWLLNWFVDLFGAIVDDFGDFEEMFVGLFNNWSYYFGEPLWIISSISIVIAIIVFVVFNNTLISKNKNLIKEDNEIKNLSSEQALIALKLKLDNGEITEEEYQAQRKIVINKI